MLRRRPRRRDSPGRTLRLAGRGLVVDGPGVAGGQVVADRLGVARRPLVADQRFVADRPAVTRGQVVAGWPLVADDPFVADGAAFARREVVAARVAVAGWSLVADDRFVADRSSLTGRQVVADGATLAGVSLVADRAAVGGVVARAAAWWAVLASRSPRRCVVARGPPGRRGVFAGRAAGWAVFAHRALITDRRVLGGRHLACVAVSGRLAAAALRRRRLLGWRLAADRLRRARGPVTPLRGWSAIAPRTTRTLGW
ncbi:hypothetical protein Amsp01_024150 [Amycolatopsis sp. NBRC 101858]|nr:hypothetical protein Amsp01_024150 [Amycolatopsis sp. NBRC 101858]